MNNQDNDLESLQSTFEELNSEASGSQEVLREFTREIGTLRGEAMHTEKELNSLSKSFGNGLRKAFDGVIFDGEKLSDTLATLGRSMLNSTYSQAIKPIQDTLGSTLASGLSGLFDARSQSGRASTSVTKESFSRLASGRLVEQTAHRLSSSQNNIGSLGVSAPPEANPGRTPRTSASVNVVMNISTPDAESFRRSKSQIGAEMSRLIGQGQRNQ